MKQIIIQKKYLILVEYGDNLYKLFLIIVNFIFNISDQCLAFMFDNAQDFYDFVQKVTKQSTNYFYKRINYFKALFGFNIYSLSIKYLYKFNSSLYKSLFYRQLSFKINLLNNRFLKYNNLLAPPQILSL
jgi:hypothetical protein